MVKFTNLNLEIPLFFKLRQEMAKFSVKNGNAKKIEIHKNTQKALEKFIHI